jgi:hypothetical protein
MSTPPQRCTQTVTVMISGSVRGAVKPKLSLASEGHFFGWLRVRGSHDVQSTSSQDAHQQDEYPDATDPAGHSPKTFRGST